MRIGEISKRTALSRDTIRFYEKKGLISVKSSDSLFNNYKDYDETTLNRLMLIKKAKSFGFTLNEILDLLTQVDANKANCRFFQEKMVEKIKAINQEIEALENKKKQIYSHWNAAQETCATNSENANCQLVTS